MKRHYFELEPGSALEDGLSGGRVKVAKYQGKRVRLRRQWMNPPGRSLHGTPDHAWTILESRLRSSIDHVKKRRHHGSMICAVAAGCLPTQGILTGHIDGVSLVNGRGVVVVTHSNLYIDYHVHFVNSGRNSNIKDQSWYFSNFKTSPCG